ncbi:MAG: radical SAM protein [Leptospiraceae bacterium]|nr:radical SAM protein [Leptospiraceae bacterium]MCK6379876.1 radical SAM protein [Leptospiraceae bacterium]
MIIDKKNRQFKKLRVSLLQNCNFSCAYCSPSGSKLVNTGKQTPVNEILENISRIHDIVGLESIRLTGGEPSLYKNLIELILGLKKLNIPRIALTTNGSRLKKSATSLKNSGLDSINVSLDSISEEIFQKINRFKGVGTVLEGIESALNAGIEVKINCTVMKGINETQILPILEWAKERNITTRYLELMKMGSIFYSHQDFYFSEKNIIEIIQQKYNLIELGRKKSDTCTYWEIPGSIKIGVISNHSNPFCSDCDRLRMDYKGNIYGCLSENTYFPIQKEEKELKIALEKAILLKKERIFSGSSISMQSIGG